MGTGLKNKLFCSADTFTIHANTRSTDKQNGCVSGALITRIQLNRFFS